MLQALESLRQQFSAAQTTMQELMSEVQTMEAAVAEREGTADQLEDRAHQVCNPTLCP